MIFQGHLDPLIASFVARSDLFAKISPAASVLTKDSIESVHRFSEIIKGEACDSWIVGRKSQNLGYERPLVQHQFQSGDLDE